MVLEKFIKEQCSAQALCCQANTRTYVHPTPPPFIHTFKREQEGDKSFAYLKNSFGMLSFQEKYHLNKAMDTLEGKNRAIDPQSGFQMTSDGPGLTPSREYSLIHHP